MGDERPLLLQLIGAYANVSRIGIWGAHALLLGLTSHNLAECH